MIEACVAAGPGASPGTAAASGADLGGWSALALLGTATAAEGRWLFITGPDTGWISRGPITEARFDRISGLCSDRWPMDDGVIAGVVIDGGALRRQGAVYARTLVEARRVCQRSENVLVVCSHRTVPRHLREWHEYGRRTVNGWRRAATSVGIELAPTATLRLDGARVTEVILPGPTDRGRGSLDGNADRIVLTAGRDRSALELMLDAASRMAGLPFALERISVRKIGKTALFLSGPDARRYVMRVARTPVALARAARNFDTLERLHRADLPQSLKARVPEPLAAGFHVGLAFRVETCLAGTAGPPKRQGTAAGHEWAAAAVDYICALHAATARQVTCDTALLHQRIHAPLATIARAWPMSETGGILRRLGQACERSLGGQALPLVHTHGDFTESNCLFDATGQLTGVVDWELAEPRGLPLLDLLQLMPVTGETDSAPRWQRFDAWLELYRHPERMIAEPVWGRYFRALGLSPERAGALILLQWIMHVADRIEVRRDDPRWVRLRVQQPLDTLGRIFRD